ncbi:hypothetical protein EV361DRAFT_942933 [Lentinula raphanica]|nr:hypothetical protein EV361DRAFT_942933 [Lentinula raphanica]
MAPTSKRQRTNTAGDDDHAKENIPPNITLPSTSTVKPDGTLPESWAREVHLLPSTTPIPPKTVVKKFLEIYVLSLKDFAQAQNTLQKATLNRQKFEQDASKGIPPYIANSLKGPAFSFAKVIATSAHEEISEARTEFEVAMAAAGQAAVKYTRSCHETSVSQTQALVDVDKCALSLQEQMTAYATEIIDGTGHGATTLWNAYIQAVTTAFKSDLVQASYEFTAKQIANASTRDAKAAAVNAAQHDAEMEDATKPIGKILDERFVEMKAQMEALTKRLNEKDKELMAKFASTSKPKGLQPKTKDSIPEESSKTAKKPKDKGKGRADDADNVGEDGKGREMKSWKKKGETQKGSSSKG